MLDPSDLRGIDKRLLDFLHERSFNPSYGHKRLLSEGKQYTPGYVQERLAYLTSHGHVENLLDSGTYELVSDPREQEDDH